MPSASFQTIRLSRGSHRSPSHGACAMELASMLAGERFTDHPRSVCPVIAAVLRAYNDGLDDERRQDLYPYASAAVGTRDRRARKARTKRLVEFFAERGLPVPGSFLMSSQIAGLGRSALTFASSADESGHREFLKLLDELAGDGVRRDARAAAPAAAWPHPPPRGAR